MFTEFTPIKHPTHYTLTIVNGLPEVTDHQALKEAEAHANELAAEGHECTILKVLRVVPIIEPQYSGLDEYNGVRRGFDHPETMTGGAA